MGSGSVNQWLTNVNRYRNQATCEVWIGDQNEACRGRMNANKWTDHAKSIDVARGHVASPVTSLRTYDDERALLPMSLPKLCIID
jgi:hypothetical protein